eukprot:scaffold34059_cov44-Attheya_sp.AAC.1
MAVGDDNTEKDANSSSSVLSGALGFVLSGDGDDHGHMATGEFHVFDPSFKPSSGTATGRWRSLSRPHPGRSRWAPGSFVVWDTAQVYFSGGYDHRCPTIPHDNASSLHHQQRPLHILSCCPYSSQSHETFVIPCGNDCFQYHM